MQVRELIGLGAAVLVLAGISVAIINGDKTAKVLQASASGFGDIIRAATLQGGSPSRAA